MLRPLLDLLRDRPRFRLLYIADAFSMIGDWLTYVAVGLLALRGPQGLFGVALVQVAHSLPQAVAAPFAGWLTDRVDRRTILVVASFARGAITAGMAFAAAHEEIEWVEGLLFLRMAGAAFIITPSRAALPSLVEDDELEPANRLAGTSWALLFTIGVALGGLVTGALGPTVALMIDVGTFVVAGLLFIGLGRLPPGKRRTHDATDSLSRNVRLHPERLRAALAKVPALFAGGAAWVILHSLVGSGAGAAYGLGGLHAARGMGNASGPWIFRRFGERRTVVFGALVTFVGLVVLTTDAGPIGWTIGCVLWGLGIGATWVGATVWLQKIVPDSILGRYAALDVGATSLASACGGVGAALLSLYFSPLATAAVIVGVGSLWLVAIRPRAAIAAAIVLAVALPARAQTSVHDALDARAVTTHRIVRRDLYTWTSTAQARELRRDRRLLTSGPADGAVRAPYQRALDELVARGGQDAELARALTEHPDLRRRRYAWPTPYGTVVPRGSRGYGSILVHIRLRRDAFTLRFAPEETPAFRAVDGEGQSVPLARVIADPTRIGAVLHVRRSARMGPYREYIVHGRVERWSMGTDALRARVDEDLWLLRHLRALPADRGSMLPHWDEPRPTLASRFAATMPFDTARHRPSPETASALLRELRRRRPRGPPLLVAEP